MDVRQLIAAGSQKGSRCSLQKFHIHVVADLFPQIHDLFLQQTLNAIAHTVYGIRSHILCCLVDTCQTGIDHRCGASGLSYDHIFFHNFSPSVDSLPYIDGDFSCSICIRKTPTNRILRLMGVLILKVPSNLFYQTYSLSGNSKFLIRRNYHNSGLAVRSGNSDLLATLVVRLLIDGYSQEAQLLAYQGTN